MSTRFQWLLSVLREGLFVRLVTAFPLNHWFAIFLLTIGLGAISPGVTLASDVAPVAQPKYKPSARSPEALNVLTNAYGGSASAPQALQIADSVPDFVLPRAGGGEVSLEALRSSGPVALIFYRGHW